MTGSVTARVLASSHRTVCLSLQEMGWVDGAWSHFFSLLPPESGIALELFSIIVFPIQRYEAEEKAGGFSAQKGPDWVMGWHEENLYFGGSCGDRQDRPQLGEEEVGI